MHRGRGGGSPEGFGEDRDREPSLSVGLTRGEPGLHLQPGG